ncbi:MAG: 2-dehydro-3-deoxygalactonokinase [Clostridia bacterium]|nr:2-dehydro-3-deoxygalactonokinase [Clostridia bacterium]
MILTIDGGTTNTRFCIMDNGRLLSAEKLPLGIRDTLTENRTSLFRHGIAEKIRELIAKYEASDNGIRACVFSGMITSEAGLYSVPHISVPVGIKELAAQTACVMLHDIAPIPFYFIPGVKTYEEIPVPSDAAALMSLDIMRGEETELVGIMTKLHLTKNGSPHIFLLPGSHMKIVSANGAGQILSFRTAMTGELFRAAAEHTILTASLDGQLPDTVDAACLRLGFDCASENGFAEAAFKVRLIHRCYPSTTPSQRYSFLLGAVLEREIHAVRTADVPVVIAGSQPFRCALAVLLGDILQPQHILCVPDNVAEHAAAYGADAIYHTIHAMSAKDTL